MVDEKTLYMAFEIIKTHEPDELIKLAVKIADEHNDKRLEKLGI